MRAPVALTPRGIGVLGGAAALAVLGWLFGLPEASVLACGGAAAVALALAQVLLRPPSLDVRRHARPARVPLGDPCDIRLSVANRTHRSSPTVSLVDRVGQHGEARLALAPMPPGDRARSTYSLSTHRRGVQRVGPLHLSVEDPFGLARRRTVSSSTTTVMVLPRTFELAPLPPAPGDEPEHGIRTLVSTSTVDEEFTSLRGYVAGDDIRRIHWPSTARVGTPMVRQFDVPWQRRSTVLLDVRASHHDAASFERAVSVAASLVVQAAERGELIRLVTTAGRESGFVSARDELDDLLDRLAVVRSDPSTDATRDALLDAVDQLTQTATGRLIVCTGSLGSGEVSRLDESAGRAGLHVLVLTGRAPEGVTSRDGAIVAWDGGVPLAERWHAATASLGGRSRQVTVVRP